MTSAVEGLFSVITAAVNQGVTLVIGLLNAIIPLFWTATSNEPTFLGVLLLVAAALPLVFWGINFIVRLINRVIRRTR